MAQAILARCSDYRKSWHKIKSEEHKRILLNKLRRCIVFPLRCIVYPAVLLISFLACNFERSEDREIRKKILKRYWI